MKVKAKVEYLMSEEMQKRYSKLLDNEKYANQPDDDEKNPWHGTYLQKKITRLDAAGLQIIGLLRVKQKVDLTDQMKKVIRKFIEQNIGNREFNSVLGELLKLNISLKIYSESLINKFDIIHMRKFTFKTRDYLKIEECIKNLPQISNDESLSELNNKLLTLEEFAFVYDFSSIYIPPNLTKILTDSENSKLKNFVQNFHASYHFINLVNKNKELELNELKGGLLFF